MKGYIGWAAAIDKIYTSTVPALEVKAMPVTNMVEVVRCGECKHWKQRDNREYGLCAKHRGVWLNSDYCSKGEYKEGGKNE